MKKSLFLLLLLLVPIAMLNAQPISDSTDTESEVFVVVEVSPQYPGGLDALMVFLSTNIVYPKEAMDNGFQGTVYVSFIVEKDGSISTVKVLRGVHPLLDDEAVRVVNMMPNWSPGLQRGKPVRVQFNLPIRFILSDDNPKNEEE